jgi:hypothetical protein
MSHDCRLGHLEVVENKEGYLYLQDISLIRLGTEKLSRIEYCPICGEKSKKSHIESITMFDRDPVAEDQLKHMHDIIMESFLKSCEILVKEDLDDKSFKFCMDTIHNTLAYVGAKRKEDNDK